MTSPRPLVCDGQPTPPARVTLLRAGPLSAEYVAGALRVVRWHHTELLRGVYAAVRDANWGTVPATILDEAIDQTATSFRVAFTSAHQAPGIAFRWHALITGDATGTLRFTFDGTAETTFARNRIGFCVLHPMTAAGAPVTIQHATPGAPPTTSTFPVDVAPHQPFLDVRAITHAADSTDDSGGVGVRVAFEGDTFETEDQRNWSDASYKTYCTPLAQPFPVVLEAGTRVQQAVTLSVLPAHQRAAQQPRANNTDVPPPAPTPEAGRAVELRLPPPPWDDGAPAVRLPLGVGIAHDLAPLSATDAERLRALHLAHLHVPVPLHDRAAADHTLAVAQAQASQIGVPLLLALHLNGAAAAQLAALAHHLDAAATPLAGVHVFQVGHKTTPPALIALAQQHLARFGVPVGGGTDAFFTELNRARPPAAAPFDELTFSLNPQVHASDNTSLVETLAAHAPPIATARAFAAGRPLHVGPVTLRMRWNPNATTTPPPPPPATLPPEADVRQATLFGAGWLLGSIAALVASRAVARATYVETTGVRGLLARDPLTVPPDVFPAQPGGAYPAYHVFAWLARFAGGTLAHVPTPDAMRLSALAAAHGRDRALLLAAHSEAPLTVRVPWGTTDGALTLLDATTAPAATTDPLAFQRAPGTLLPPDADGTVTIVLAPYALACLRHPDESAPTA